MLLKRDLIVAGLALIQGALASLQIVRFSWTGELIVKDVSLNGYVQVPGATWTAAGTNQHVQAHGGGK